MNEDKRDFVELYEDMEAEILCEMATEQLHKRTGRDDLFFLPFDLFGTNDYEGGRAMTLNDEYGLMYVDIVDCINDMAYVAERMIAKIEEIEEERRERKDECIEVGRTRLKINPVSGTIEVESI